jgi:hypothetical protein
VRKAPLAYKIYDRKLLLIIYLLVPERKRGTFIFVFVFVFVLVLQTCKEIPEGRQRFGASVPHQQRSLQGWESPPLFCESGTCNGFAPQEIEIP